MEKDKLINEEANIQICEGGNSKKNTVAKLAVGALCAVAGIGVTMFLKKRNKNQIEEAEIVEEKVVESDNESDNK